MAAWALSWIVVRGLSSDASHSLQRATELAQRAMSLEDITGLPHLMMAQIYLLKNDHDKALNRTDEARRISFEVLRISPGFALEKYAATQPYRDPQTLAQVIEMLQKAGL